MKINKLVLIILGTALFFSCSPDDDITSVPLPGAYENGFFVVNEGNATKGTVSFVSNDLNTVQQDIYGTVNSDDGIGGYVQSVFFDGDKAYIISSGSNKITIVNKKTFKLIGKIETGFNNPRYGVVVNGKAYVTNQKNFSDDTDDYLAVINLSNNTLETPIGLEAIGERIFSKNGKVYVANGSFGSGKTIKIVNTTTNTVEKTLTLDNSPNSMFEKNGFLYVLCSNDTTNSKLVKINLSTDAIDTTIEFDVTLKNAQNLSVNNDKFYFNVGKKIYDEELTTTTISTEALFTTTATTLYGFNVNKGKIFIADAKDYSTNGKAYIYDLSGSLLKEIETGVIPNGFYFN
jgi:YVTN family beta-propeller protein